MTRLDRAGPLAAMLVALTMLSGCLPLPDVRPTTAPLDVLWRVAPSDVPSWTVRVAGVDVPSTPSRYDAQTTLRWGLSEPVDTIVIAVPGLFGGAAQFGPLARRLVAGVPGLQVWAVDRRANALEDLAPAHEAWARSDTELLTRTYLGTEDAAPTFRAPDRDAFAFVADWGLATHLADLDAVVREARAEAPRVVLLGHSLGASQVALYSAWKGPEGSGRQPIDGLVLVDGAPGRTGAYGYPRGFRLFGIPVVLPSREAVEEGRAAPWTTLGEGGATYARRLASAMLAAMAPDQPAPAAAGDVPMTNRAFAGIVHDDQYGAFRVHSASLGEAVNAELDGNVFAVLVGGLWAGRSGSVVGVAEGAERVDWGPGDPRYERTDFAEYLRIWTGPDVDAAEWYVPTTLLLDLAALSPDLADEDDYVPMREVATPTLAVGSDRGLLRDVDAFGGYAEQRLGAPLTVTILSGLTHVDILTARDNPLVPLLARWVTLLP
ncbi:MAG: hypothetical protein U5J97_05220 [Trueperaceae bacterium]|nr:hypothetical protein [Trueperaceae bacterium]